MRLCSAGHQPTISKSRGISQIIIISIIIVRAVSRDFFGTPFFEMVIFPYRDHGCLGVRKLQDFNISDPLKTYSVESNT